MDTKESELDALKAKVSFLETQVAALRHTVSETKSDVRELTRPSFNSLQRKRKNRNWSSRSISPCDPPAFSFIPSDDLVTAFDDSVANANSKKSPEIEADAVNSREFIRVDSFMLSNFVEPSILESTNRRVHSEGKSSPYCELFPYSAVHRAVHEFCPLPGYWRLALHVQQHLPSFPHSPFIHFPASLFPLLHLLSLI